MISRSSMLVMGPGVGLKMSRTRRGTPVSFSGGGSGSAKIALQFTLRYSCAKILSGTQKPRALCFARGSSRGEPTRRPSITQLEVYLCEEKGVCIPRRVVEGKGVREPADALIFICRPTSSSSSGSFPTTSRRIPATAAVIC